MKLNLAKFVEPTIENLEKLVDENNAQQFIDYLASLAEAGDESAALRYFKIFMYGNDFVEMDESKALNFLEKFAERSQSGAAARELGKAYCYVSEDEVSDREEKALRWLRVGANLYDGEAAYILGKSYFYGLNGLSRDLEAAADYLEKALKYGYAEHYSILASLYLRSKSNEEKRRGADLMVRGAKVGDTKCQYTLGASYLNGTNGFPKNETLGIHWLKEAADGYYNDALLALGDFYLQGRFVEENHFEAFHYISESARLHSKVGQVRLSTLYLLGIGVEKNLTLASAWIRIAELNKDPEVGDSNYLPEKRFFSGRLIDDHILNEHQRRHADRFVEDFTKGDWSFFYSNDD